MKFDKASLLLYAVTDRYWLGPGETLAQAVEKALKGGTTFVQLREKNAPFQQVTDLGRELLSIYREAGVTTPLIIFVL